MTRLAVSRCGQSSPELSAPIGFLERGTQEAPFDALRQTPTGWRWTRSEPTGHAALRKIARRTNSNPSHETQRLHIMYGDA